MKFVRRNPIPPRKHYHSYRDALSEDFRGFCAYCFRHYEEVGGDEHFEIDHFMPVGKGGDRDDYMNCYWSCKGCNGPGKKHGKWPTLEEQDEGRFFVDSCKEDPFDKHYTLVYDRLDPLTNAGTWTIREIKLNDRPALREWRVLRDERRRRLLQQANTLHKLQEKLAAKERESVARLAAFAAALESQTRAVLDSPDFHLRMENGLESQFGVAINELMGLL